MRAGEWFQIASGPQAGRWRMAGWILTAIKGDDTSIPGGATDRSEGWLGLAICPRCHVLVIADEEHVFGDQQWPHEDWHHRTDYPHPEES